MECNRRGNATKIKINIYNLTDMPEHTVMGRKILFSLIFVHAREDKILKNKFYVLTLSACGTHSLKSDNLVIFWFISCFYKRTT